MLPSVPLLLALALLPTPRAGDPSTQPLTVEAYLAQHNTGLHPVAYEWCVAHETQRRQRALLGLDDETRRNAALEMQFALIGLLQDAAAEHGLYIEPAPDGRPLSALPEPIREELAFLVSALHRVAPEVRWWWAEGME